MGQTIVARNYAETLLALANRHGGAATVDEYGVAINEVADLLDREPLIREFLETPRVSVEQKKKALQASFRGRVPDLFLRFLLIVVEKRRGGVLREIAEQYHQPNSTTSSSTKRRAEPVPTSSWPARPTTSSAARSFRLCSGGSARKWSPNSPSIRRFWAASWSG
jgi:hypothetical protein